MEGGQAARALERATAAVAAKAKLLGEKHAEVAQLRGIAAMALAKTGQPDHALAEFRAAVPILLTRSREAQDEGDTAIARGQLRQQILESYMGVLAEVRASAGSAEAREEAAAEACRLGEVARGQAVERALSASGARAAAKDPALADLVRREQDAQQSCRPLRAPRQHARRSARGGDRRPGPRAADPHRPAPGGARLPRRRDRAPVPGLRHPRPSEARHCPGRARGPTRRRGADRVLRGPGPHVLWAVPAEGPVAFAATPLDRAAARGAVARLREALAPDARTLGEIPPFDVAVAHGLYTTLLGPVEASWKPASSLLIVAHDALGQLPLGLLRTAPPAVAPEREPLFARYREVPWLIRTHAVTVLPSVTSLTILRGLPPGDPGRRPFLGSGDPYFSPEQAARAARGTAAAPPDPSPSREVAVRGLPLALRSSPKTQGVDSSQLALLPRLPETADEIRAIALALRADVATDVFAGPRANEQVVKRLDLSGYRVLAFATHGLVPGDLDGLTQPALALSAPEVAGVDGDGLLTMEEILASV